MPTLCESDNVGVSFGESANMENEDPWRPQRHSPGKTQTALNDYELEIDLMNETTLSGSMIETGLQAMKIGREAPVGPALCLSHIERRKGSEHHFRDSFTRSLETEESNKILRDLRQEYANQVVGPFQAIYRAEFAEKVSRWIDRGRTKYPHALCDYYSLSSAEKKQEEESVMKLLSRLKIHVGASDSELATRKVEENNEACAVDKSGRSLSVRFKEKLYGSSLKATGSSMCSPSERPAETDNNNDESTDDEHDPSGLLFSPPLHLPATPMNPRWQSPAGETSRDSDSSSSTIPIEKPRAGSSFFSPPAAIQRKRMASMSGKRGTDQVRLRTDGDSYSSEFSVDDDDFPIMREHRPVGTSSDQQNVFPASQSPISPRCSSLPLYSPDVSSPPTSNETQLSLEAESDGDSMTTQRSDSSEESLPDLRCERSSWRHPLPFDHSIQLKTGAIYHYKALETKYNQAARSHDFLDPLAGYEGSLGRRISTLFNSLYCRDKISAGLSNALITSMSGDQIRNLSLKLLLSNPPVNFSQDRPGWQRYSQVSDGQTLIVVRDKATLAEWITTFRHGSPFSVLNFFDLSLRQRKSHSTAAKLSKYDIVLVTFDALKASDITYLVDENGHVIHQALGDHEGWLRNRASSQALSQTKQFSILHSLSWHRIIFVDMIGPKCFLAKPDTSRSMASAAITSTHRYLFLSSSEEDKSVNPVDKIQGDRTVLASFASVLGHTDGNRAMSLQQVLLDLLATGKR